MLSHVKRQRSGSKIGQRLERLEARRLLDVSGFIWGDAPQLTLSFAQEGTSVAGLPSSLRGAFEDLGAEAAWQGTILRAFQTWAALTNGDIGVVPDGGEPFGVPGHARDDSRFGDVRITAVPLANDVLAVSVPSNTIVAGSWSGDVLFNSNAAWTSLDDLFSVAVHEAGHVFGLEHTDNPASPMHVHGISSATAPTTDDIAALRARHGVRMADLNEYASGGNDGVQPGILVGNNTPATATRMQPARDGLGTEGSAPSIIHGDISDSGDVDFYTWDGLSDYDGPKTITVRSRGMSLLAPAVELRDEQGATFQAVASDAIAGDTVTFRVERSDPNTQYFLRVAGGDPAFGVGHYSVTVSFDQVTTADADRIARFAGRDFRFATSDQFQDLFEDSASAFFNDDDHADDDPTESGELDTTVGFAENTRYEAISSIADAADVDHYRFASPAFPAGQAVPLTIVFTALESGGLIPRLELLTGELQAAPATILANGNGQLVLQLASAAPEEEYVLQVAAADSAGAHATGNFRLSIIFGGQAAEVTDFAGGLLTADDPVDLHALHVGQSQLLHLLLDTSETTATSGGAWLTVYDSHGAVRGRVGALAGDTRSGGAMLLEPGSYTVQVAGLSLDGAAFDSIAYQLRGVTISGPLGPILHDPTNDPVYFCPDQPDMFCYPGGVQSPSPYLWNDFILSEPGGQPPADPGVLFNDWWNWFWSLQPGDTNGDQAVNLTDLNNVRNHFGETGPAPLGDTDGDGMVTLDDLNRVRNNFGAGEPAPAAPLVRATSSAIGTAGAGASTPPSRGAVADALFAKYVGEAVTLSQKKRANRLW